MTGGLNEFDLEHKFFIGRGRYADVYRVKNISTGENFAMKIINLQYQTEPQFFNEIEMLQTAQHPNLVGVRAAYIVDRTGYIVMKLCEGGTLSSKIATDGGIVETKATRYMKSILEAVAYLHSINIIHRDIKPDNIYFETTDDDSPILLGDFGLSKFLSEGVTVTRVGTPGYQSPQIIQGHLYTFKTDIWSVGVLTYTLLQGIVPFNVRKIRSEGILLEMMRSGEYAFKLEVSAEAKDFISKCLQFDESKRPSAIELLEHPWIKKYTDQH
ncbi:hypothetical protein M9Y10_025414 [Tritrichomonas musculus]|uniref:Protein kinase domain-containing protein n=1 Tax=Tritrichomonas musculus TaxID=1915356 RepID=A0ABR2H8M0_9EUKA